MHSQSSAPSGNAQKSADVLRAETCLHSLLSWVGSPMLREDEPAIAVVVGELLRSEPTAIQAALRRVALSWTPSVLLGKRYRLTSRETDVAHHLALGQSNSEIASALSISEHTCRHHTERVLAKLGVRSRAAVGARLGELTQPARAAS
jgi:DNA-binding NarL/FixJ family response regulator